MNDPFVHQQAERWAERLVAERAPVDVRIDQMFEASLARPAAPAELASVRKFLVEQAARRGLEGPWEDDPRPWADLAHVLFNLKEFSFPG